MPLYICVRVLTFLKQQLLFFLMMILFLNSQGVNNTTRGKITVDSIVNLEKPDTRLLQTAILLSINKYRSKNNVKSLQWCDTLYESSQLHLNRMIEKNFFAHNDPKDKKYQGLQERVEKFSNQFNCLSENLIEYFPFKFTGKTIDYCIQKVKNRYIYKDPKTKRPLQILTYSQLAEGIVNSWIASKPHRQNLLDVKSNKIGLAIYFPKYYIKPNILPVTVVANFGGCLK